MNVKAERKAEKERQIDTGRQITSGTEFEEREERDAKGKHKQRRIQNILPRNR